MSYDKFGKTISSSLYRLSDALWLNEVRENIGKLVDFIGHMDAFQISKDIETTRFQKTVIGKILDDGNQLKKFKQAAVSIARIKNEFPEILRQLESSGNRMYNISSQQFIFFKHSERDWRVPEKNKEIKFQTANSFVLFAPSLSRVLSFETPELNLSFERFRFGSAKNIQLQGAFSKLKGNSGRETTVGDKFASFLNLKFIFRTIRDMKTIFSGRRLENFSFVTTSDAGENTFKIVFYFITLGKILEFASLPLSSNQPANMKKIKIVDSTGEQIFQMFDDVDHEDDFMKKSIDVFFGLDKNQEALKFHKNNFVLTISRWGMEDKLPEILYLRNLGDLISQPKIDNFYMLAYLNTRKKVEFQNFKENFPNCDAYDEHYLKKDNYAYWMQDGWEKQLFSKIIDKSKDSGNFLFVDTHFPIGMYFHINSDAHKLYTSSSSAQDFAKIYNTSLSSWDYVIREGDFVNIQNDSLESYVATTLMYLVDKGKTTLLAQGRTISKAADISQIIVSKIPGCFIGIIKISSEIINDGYGRSHYVSNIRIPLVIKKSVEETPSIPNYYGL